MAITQLSGVTFTKNYTIEYQYDAFNQDLDILFFPSLLTLYLDQRC